MIRDIQRIKAFIRERATPGHPPYRLANIRDAVINLTVVDRIVIRRVPVDDQNQFQGRYMRFNRHPSPYSQLETVVEIECASRLNYCWSRFVICKEMCQALFCDPDVVADSEAKMSQLCEELRLPPEQQADLAFSPRLASEKVAEFAAWEIMCPLDDRREILNRRSRGQEIDDLAIAEAFRIPVAMIPRIFDETYVSVVSNIFDSVEETES